MKKIISLFVLSFLLLACFPGKANEIIVKGFVKYSNGSPARGVVVKIVVETPCVIEYKVTTNNDGYYQEKLKCPEAIKKVRLTIVCGGQVISVLKEVPAGNVIEANLTMCAESNTCLAKFNFEHVPASASQKYRIRFNSNSSEAKAGDEIVERKWKFGDGETGNSVDPVHNYAKPGVYEVCLTIKTAGGCTNTKCIPVEIKEGCHADFIFGLTPAGVKFNSNSSAGGLTDPIKSRTWNFGDGSPLLRGDVEPLHIFTNAGTYNVCLNVVTNGGCETKMCKQVVIPVSASAACGSQFSFERLSAGRYRFNSQLSKATGEDRIVERLWDFRDGSPQIKTNEPSVIHEFSKPGLYEVCLKIRTARGCESRVCLAVRVEAHTPVDGPSVSIINLYPTPFHNELKASIYSIPANVHATISIVDVYGQIKITKQVLLAQGSNTFTMETATLLAGPYFFKTTTAYGTHSRTVYKQ